MLSPILKTTSLIAIVACTAILSACGGGGGKSTPDKPGPAIPHRSEDSRRPDPIAADTCPVVFDKNLMAQSGIALPTRLNGFLISARSSSLTTCRSTSNINGQVTTRNFEGYSKLTAYSPPRPTSKFALASASDPTNSLELAVDTDFESSTPDAPAIKKALAESLKGIMSRYTENSIDVLPSIRFPRNMWAVFSDGSVSEAQLLVRDSKSYLSIRFPKSHGAGIVDELNTAALMVKIYNPTSSIYGSVDLFSEISLQIEGSGVTARLQMATVAQPILALWLDARQQSERVDVLLRAGPLLEQFPSPTAREDLNEIYLVADREWTPLPDRILNRQWSLATLAILNKLNPEHPSRAIYATTRSLEPSLGTKAIEAAIWLTKTSGLSTAQQSVVVDTVVYLSSLSLPQVDLLKEATAAAAAHDYSMDKIRATWSRIILLYPWLRHYSGPNFDDAQALEVAKNLVLVKQVSEQKISDIKEVFAWMIHYSGPSQSDRAAALGSSEKLALNPVYSQKFFQLTKNVFGWLVHYSGPSISDRSNALVITLNYLIDFEMSAPQFEDLGSHFRWLTHYSGPNLSEKMRALKIAEGYVLRQKLTQQESKSLREFFSWLIHYSGPNMSDKSAALLTAERYVVTQKLDLGQLVLLKNTFNWLIHYSGPNLSDRSAALSKAESYLISRSMNESKLEELRRHFARRLRSGSTRTVALEQAELETFGR